MPMLYANYALLPCYSKFLPRRCYGTATVERANLNNYLPIWDIAITSLTHKKVFLETFDAAISKTRVFGKNASFASLVSLQRRWYLRKDAKDAKDKCAVLLMMMVVGNVGCFTIVQNYIWLAAEALLAFIRLLVWGANLSWDDSDGVRLAMDYSIPEPLPTWNPIKIYQIHSKS
ncbi:hypothetical protein B0H14DRAFT_2564731 [Mycena olivaceomarginata]|nr:hypothetical protein B0H14DRAFT_2564731 [Mycena olivaceomarginata]